MKKTAGGFVEQKNNHLEKKNLLEIALLMLKLKMVLFKN